MGELYFKSLRLFNGKPKWVITDEYDNIVENPTREQIKVAIFDNSANKHKFVGRKCCVCGSTKTRVEGTTPKWYHCECGKKDCTVYLCSKCGMNNNYNIYQKLNAQWRNGRLDPFSNVGKGFIGQQIVAKTYFVEDCNLKMDNFHFYVDIKIPGYGLVDVQIRSLSREGKWPFNTARTQEYDNLFILCMDNNLPWINVERVYIIPWEVVVNRGRGVVCIAKLPSRYSRFYEEFRIDEKPFNDTYHSMKLENCKILRSL